MSGDICKIYPLSSLPQDITEAFASLFKGRTDAWGTITGGCQREAVTIQHYERHLQGKVSLGIYLLRPDSTCYFFAIDIDKPDFNIALMVRNAFTEDLGIPAYIARSKSGNFHIYVFAFDRFEAKEVRSVARRLLKKLGLWPMELFPKQDDASTVEFGNYINLPYFGKDRPVLDIHGREIPLHVFLERVKTTPPELIEKALANLPEQKELSSSGETTADITKAVGILPCMRNFFTKGAFKDTNRNKALFRCAIHYRNMGFSEEMTQRLIMDANLRHCDEALPESEVEGLVRSAFHGKQGRGYSSLGCDDELWAGYYCNDEARRTCPIRRSQVPRDENRRTSSLDELEVVSQITASPSFIQTYVAHGSRKTDSPIMFHIATAIGILAGAMGDRISYISWGGLRKYPNVWLVLVAPSGFYRKTTALNIGRVILREAMPNAFLPDEFSLEGLEQVLQDQPWGIWLIGELGAFLGSLDRTYMGGGRALLSHLFDSQPFFRRLKRTKGKKEEEYDLHFQATSLTLVSATTARWFEERAKLSDLEGGLLARFLYLRATHKNKRIQGPIPEDLESREFLVDHLRELASLSGEADFSLVQDTIDELIESHEERHANVTWEVEGIYSRYGEYLKKLSIIIEVSFPRPWLTNGKLMITLKAVEIASLLLNWLMQEAMTLFTEDFTFSWFGRNEQRVFRLISQNGSIERAKLIRYAHVSKKDLDNILDTLFDADRIGMRSEPASDGGRRKRFYYPKV